MAFLRDRSIFCLPENLLGHEQRHIISGICIFTATLGFAGAAFQLCSMRQFRNRQRRWPSPNPDIIRCLAVSDLISCIGVIALAICLIVMKPPKQKEDSSIYVPQYNSIYEPIGTALEIITMFGYLSSYLWTLFYAVDACSQIYEKECSMVVYHILAWGIPVELITIIEAVNLGEYPHVCEEFYGRFSRVLLSYTPVMVIVIANPIIFIVTYGRIKKKLRSSGSFNDDHRNALYTMRRRFFWMVTAFVFCWLPNIVSVTIYYVMYKKILRTAVAPVLWYTEACLNPLQGFFNYFLYRHAFKVTPTDTRPMPNSLPPVRITPSWSIYRADRRSFPPKGSKNQTLQRVTTSESSHDEESPLIPPETKIAKTGPRYVYISRLLGE